MWLHQCCWLGNKKAYFPGGLHLLIPGTLKVSQNQMVQLKNREKWFTKCPKTAKLKHSNEGRNKAVDPKSTCFANSNEHRHLRKYYYIMELSTAQEPEPMPVLGEIPFPFGKSKRLKWFGQNLKQLEKKSESKNHIRSWFSMARFELFNFLSNRWQIWSLRCCHYAAYCLV